MAAILRFGAEDLFKEDEAAAAGGGEGGAGEQHALGEEELDAILARAEVGGKRSNGGAAPRWARCARHAALCRARRAAPAPTRPPPPPHTPPSPQIIHDTGQPHGQAPGRMGDLLGQFSVATFKTSALGGACVFGGVAERGGRAPPAHPPPLNLLHSAGAGRLAYPTLRVLMPARWRALLLPLPSPPLPQTSLTTSSGAG